MYIDIEEELEDFDVDAKLLDWENLDWSGESVAKKCSHEWLDWGTAWQPCRFCKAKRNKFSGEIEE